MAEVIEVEIELASELDIKPKMGQINQLTLGKNDISEKFKRFFKKFRLNSKEI